MVVFICEKANLILLKNFGPWLIESKFQKIITGNDHKETIIEYQVMITLLDVFQNLI